MGYFYSKPSPPSDPIAPVMETGWCKINWGENNEIKENLRKIQPKNPAIKQLRILVVGPVGAGKSSFIQSVENIFQSRMTNAALKVDTAAGFSFTKNLHTYKFKDEHGNRLPFVIDDVMGLESTENSGVHPNDITNVLKGHIKEGYKFQPKMACPKKDRGYNSYPALNDKVHCLVFVLPINNFSANNSCAEVEKEDLIVNDLTEKIQEIRQEACDLRIPHVVVLTKVDLACPHVKEDIKCVYRSRAIYRKVQACSNAFGVPMNCIFPVKNYHEEMQLNPDMDALLLFTLTQVLDYANDFVEEMNDLEAANCAKDHTFKSLNFYIDM